MKKEKEEFQVLRGSAHFRYKLALATVTGKKIKMSEIRREEANPGITDYEADFIKLLQKITEGSRVKLNKTGTKVKYTPGIITNNYGVEIVHECNKSRGVVYYLEGIFPLIFFGKEPLNLTLVGATNDNIDVSIDSFKNVMTPLMAHFGLEESIVINVVERGIYPDGGGKVVIKCPLVKHLGTINLTEEGKVKRIRGLAYACKTSPQLCNRIVETMRGIFIDYIPDVWIHTDHSKSGLSGGYGTSVIAETTTGVLFSADSIYVTKAECTPETVGRECALRILDEVLFGGCIDTSFQPLVLCLMAISSNAHVSSIKLGRISKYTVGLLRVIIEFLKVKFKIEDCEDNIYDMSDSEDGEHEKDKEAEIGTEAPLILSCLGWNVSNIARAAFT